MFEVVGQDIISGNMGFIGTDSDRLYRMGAAEKTEDITVTGNPAVLDNATGKPFRGLHIYGRSEQMTTTGAQLLDLDAISLATGGGATIKRLDDGGFLVDGTPEQAYEQYITKVVINLAPGAYFVSGGRAADGCAAVQINILNADGTRTYKNNASFDVLGTEQEITLVIQSVSEKPINNYKIYPMINSGSVAMPFEPYTGGKPSPSPDYPQEIVSAGADGNIGVEVHGKNIFGGRYYYALYSNGVLFIDKGRKDEEVKFPYQPKTETSGICKVLKCQKGKTYVISVTNPNKNATIGMAEFKNIEDMSDETNAVGYTKMKNETKQLYTAKSDGILVCGIAGTWTDGKTTTHECTESELLQVEEALEATSYEPHHTSQTLTLSTPNGLPGIPVSSGGNYTDENGKQWICDEVDLGRGVYVQRVYSVNVDGVDVVFSQGGAYCNMDLRELPSAKIVGESSQRAATKSTFTSEPWNFNQEFGFLYLIKENYAEILNESCKKHPGEVIYALATPIETPLTASEIAAYKSLRTYRGTTIVEAEDKAGISVTYKRNAKAAEKEVNILHADLMAEMEELDENSEIV